MIGSNRGGMNIEEVAKEDPEAIIKVAVDIEQGLKRQQALEMVRKMGLPENCHQQAADVIEKLYQLFLKHDCTLLEINPMAEDNEGKGIDLVNQYKYATEKYNILIFINARGQLFRSGINPKILIVVRLISQR